MIDLSEFDVVWRDTIASREKVAVNSVAAANLRFGLRPAQRKASTPSIDLSDGEQAST
jgi:hypothetical protein